VKLFPSETAASGAKDLMSAQKDGGLLCFDGNDTEQNNRSTTNERNIGGSSMPSQQAGLQSTSSMKRKLTFIKTKNINFHSVSKLSGRM